MSENPSSLSLPKLKTRLRDKGISWPPWCKKPALIKLYKKHVWNVPPKTTRSGRHKRRNSTAETTLRTDSSGNHDQSSAPPPETSISHENDIAPTTADVCQPEHYFTPPTTTVASASQRMEGPPAQRDDAMGEIRDLLKQALQPRMRGEQPDVFHMSSRTNAVSSSTSLPPATMGACQTLGLDYTTSAGVFSGVDQSRTGQFQHPIYSLQTAMPPMNMCSIPGMNSGTISNVSNSRGGIDTNDTVDSQTTVYGITQNPLNNPIIAHSTPNVMPTPVNHNGVFPFGQSMSMPQIGVGIASDNLPHIDIVAPSVRRDIITGKDVNLAALLIPGYKTETPIRHLVQGGEIIPLKPLSDNRLTRSLTLQEFILAFDIYKNVMCEAFPVRRRELDAYQRDMIEMAHRFGSQSFYEYHRAFSGRAAALLSTYNIKVDWSQRDTKLFCSIFAGHKANSCSICNSLAHITEFCPQTNYQKTKPSFGQTHGKPDTQADKQGRPRISFKNREICNNYNTEKGCSRYFCNYTHICSVCFKAGHALPNCHGSSQKSTYMPKPVNPIPTGQLEKGTIPKGKPSAK